jgi:hypothetical protein
MAGACHEEQVCFQLLFFAVSFLFFEQEVTEEREMGDFSPSALFAPVRDFHSAPSSLSAVI